MTYTTTDMRRDSRASLSAYRWRKFERSWKARVFFWLVFPFYLPIYYLTRPKPEVSALLAIGVPALLGLAITSV